MTSNQPTAAPVPPSPPLPLGLEALARHPTQVAYGLLVLAALLAIIPIIMSLKYGSSVVWISVWGGALASCCAWPLWSCCPPGGGPLTGTDRFRLVLLTLGGVCGLLTALLGLLLPFTLGYRDTFVGGLVEWHKKPLLLVEVGAALLGGLVLMFLSLQLARGLEHSRAVLRRLLYGYNAVLSTLLLVIVLLLVNVLSFVRLPPFEVMSKTFDWTYSRQFSLNDSFAKLLESESVKKEPIHVYAITAGGIPMLRDDLERLLANCRNVNPKLTYTFLSRDANVKEVQDLMDKYTIPEPNGLLVVFGEESGKPATEFINRRDLGLIPFDVGDGRVGLTRFAGETALYKAIDFLSQGKNKPVIYFTQGNGELEITHPVDREQGPNSISKVFDNMSQGNYTPRELRYDGTEKPDQLARRLLEEASVVVVARPTRPLPSELVSALREYVKGAGNRKGKLLLLFDVVTDQKGKMIETGLEPLVAEYKIKVNDDRVISPLVRNPRLAPAIFDSKSTNPIAQSFRQGGIEFYFPMLDARSLEILPGGPAASSIRAEPLLIVAPDARPWGETNLSANPSALVREWRASGGQNPKSSAKPLVVAATVSESASPRNPMDPHAAMTENQKPVLVVFGDSTWLADPNFEGDAWSLFNSCLVWLRERPDTGVKIEPKRPEFFTPSVPPDGGLRLVLLPGALMVLSIIGLGVGVWVVRRR